MSDLSCFPLNKYCMESKQMKTTVMAKAAGFQSAVDPQWELRKGLFLRRVPQQCGEGQAQERKVTFRKS